MEDMMKETIKNGKVIRDGKVAVLVSSGFGAGWYSWNSDYEELLFNPTLVQMVLDGLENEIDQEVLFDALGLNEDDHIYTGGRDGLYVQWVDEGTQFEINEYDGSESLEEYGVGNWITA